MSEQQAGSLEEIVAYINLLVHRAGGKVEMSYDFVVAGLPGNSGLAVEFDGVRKVVVFEIRSKG